MTENSTGHPLRQTDRRDQFLLIMYGKMWDNINRHLTVVWQSSAVLAGATAVFALVEKGALSLDIASTLLVLVAGWMVLHAYDANSWFNRNLGIIANIERRFLSRLTLRTFTISSADTEAQGWSSTYKSTQCWGSGSRC